MFDRRSNDDQFAERVARPLREVESFDDRFEDALIEAIRTDRPVGGAVDARRRWSHWWSSRTINVSPFTALAAAAAVAVVAALGTMPIARHVVRGTPTEIASVSRDTVTLVRFVFVGKASSVALVGDFNAWGGRPTALDETAAGAWSTLVPLSNGRHEYAFIVDGKRWTPDPLAPVSSDDFDTPSSVMTVGT
jgi:AMP-activated protein kinase-like protein